MKEPADLLIMRFRADGTLASASRVGGVTKLRSNHFPETLGGAVLIAHGESGKPFMAIAPHSGGRIDIRALEAAE